MLDINPGILIAQIVTFILALFVLWKMAWKPLTQMIKQREETIRRDIDAAKSLKSDAEDLKKKYEMEISQAKVEAQKFVSLAISEGHREREQIITDAKNAAEKLLENTRHQLHDEKERLSGELRTEVSALAVQISEKIIQQSIDKSLQEKIFKQVMQDVEKNQGRQLQ